MRYLLRILPVRVNMLPAFIIKFKSCETEKLIISFHEFNNLLHLLILQSTVTFGILALVSLTLRTFLLKSKKLYLRLGDKLLLVATVALDR